MNLIEVDGDSRLRAEDGTVLVTLDMCHGGPVTKGAPARLHDVRGGELKYATVAWIDERAGHVGIAITGEATRMMRFRAENALAELVNDAMGAARNAYDTGDRRQSMICLNEHCADVPRQEIITADRYVCPVCGHLIKERR